MDYYTKLITTYKSHGVLVDSNLLLVYFIGKYDIERIQTFKRTCKYTIEDFQIINKFLGYFNAIITTPNILTEVSNLLNQLPDNCKSYYYKEFKNNILCFNEIYESSVSVCNCVYFEKIGLTDSGIAALSKGKYLILTDDFPLSSYLQSLDIDFINFNHIRSIKWFYES